MARSGTSTVVAPGLNRVYTFGYGRRSPEGLSTSINTQLVDVRLKPASRQPGWSKKALSARFGARYHWVPDLGNLNYKGGPIALANEERGLDFVRALLEKAPVVLLCVCPDVARCHRKVVAERLAAIGYPVTHL